MDFSNLYSGSIAPPENIVGGNEVSPPFKYPAMVSLQYPDEIGHTHRCGGILYNDRYLITAGHCVTGESDNWKVKVHRHDLYKNEEAEGAKSYNVLQRYLHPEYESGTHKHDVAIWKIDAPKGNRSNVELDTGNYGKESNEILTAIGWGLTSLVEGPSDILLEVELPVIGYETCTKNGIMRVEDDKQICAGYPEGGKDTCTGDSGGPLFKYVDGKMILVGITSKGFLCAEPGFPGVYSRVSKYAYWFKTAIESDLNHDVLEKLKKNWDITP
ncbi:trypsin-like serine protease [Conidiobolus coronatus NRRL 28638]|uniref:Trypsin-like serine protease n=1 Tax=Conidiobolus coronatus (strain ATCC 28846 / CBS 209.66 / NRRL 28638) TaxID=796925 RepID=A0A137NWB0_CONC2|nr:trypsin-like serine protease [Conidiobolus coronatus NRRL 28638]|eukprot:KXN67066.1 trypsin-like serine protease [Conidiobolus coronatus NRRL 28638]